MSRFNSVFAWLFSALLLACQAQDPTAQTHETAADMKPAIPAAHASIFSAFDLAETAAAQSDGASLLKAAEMLEVIGARPLGSEDNAAKNWALMARNMGPGGEAAALPFRGRVKGPAYRQMAIAPGESDTLSEIYYAAEAAKLSLKSAPFSGNDGSLSWTITEVQAGAEPICKHTVLDTPQTCEFTPLWTGQYSIKITNTSQHALTYLFVTN